MTAYWTCAACEQPIDLAIHGEPHSDDNGEDVHPDCCAWCADPRRVEVLVPIIRTDGMGSLGHGVATQDALARAGRVS